MIVGEIANFAAYAFAPAILVTPLGALSIIIRHGETLYWPFKLLGSIAPDNIIIINKLLFIKKKKLWRTMSIMSCSAVLAHIILREKLHIFGILGCALCVVGSTTIVLHAPQERPIESVTEVWDLATEPGSLFLWLFVSLLHILLLIYLFNIPFDAPP